MPAARLPPGVYERLLSLALDRDIQALDPKRFATKMEAPEETERPRLLARHIHSLLSLALDAQKGDNAVSSSGRPTTSHTPVTVRSRSRGGYGCSCRSFNRPGSRWDNPADGD